DGVVERHVRVPLDPQMLDASAGALAQLVQRPELDGLGGARLGACGGEPRLLSVVAERALERAAAAGQPLWPPVDHAERAAYDAVAAPVADVVLHVHRARLRSDDRARGARLETTRRLAMLAHVGREQPAEGVLRLRLARHRPRDLGAEALLLLEELHVPPRRGAERVAVIVGAGLPIDAIGRDAIPFLTGDLARLAPDADRGIGEEAHGHAVRHVCVRALVGARGPVADRHQASPSSASSLASSPTPSPSLTCPPPCAGMPDGSPISPTSDGSSPPVYSSSHRTSSGPSGRRPGKTRHRSALPSWMLTLGSADSGTRSLAESPVIGPAVPQWKGTATWWTIRSRSFSGRIR